MRVLLVVSVLVLVGCSSSPTPYMEFKKDQGYSDQILNTNLRMTTFKGNSSTKKESAELYAKFRALEICEDQKKPYTHIMLVKDKTYDKEIAQTTTTGPSYYYGASPYYGRYGGYGGVGYAYGSASTTTYNETYTYPVFEVYFECVDRPLDAGVSLINLSSSQMETLVKDLQGGVQVDDVLKDSPNQGKIQKADIIITAGGERVDKVIDVYSASRKNPGQPMKVEFFRNGVKKVTTASFADVTEMVAEAQKEIKKKGCEVEGMKDKSKLCK